MDGGQGAGQGHRATQLGQGQIGLLRQKRAELTPMRAHNQGFAAGVAVSRRQVAGAPALLEQLFDHPERDAKTSCHRLASAFARVVGGQDAGAQIKGECGHRHI